MNREDAQERLKKAKDEYVEDGIAIELAALCDDLIATLPTKEQAARREEVPEYAWNGIARDLFLAWDFGCKTPRELFEFIERCGREIPQWLRDEPEMKALDHTPSKGTRAVIVYKAIHEAIIRGGQGG